LRVQAESGRGNIHQYRLSSHMNDSLNSGDKGPRSGNDLIARPDAQHFQGEHQGISAATHADGMLHAAPLGPFRLQRLDIRPQELLHRCQGLVYCWQYLVPELAVFSFQVHQGNLHANTPGRGATERQITVL